MSGADGVRIPAPKRQRWLLEQLRVLVTAAGAAQFLRAPLVEPTPAFFPEGWNRELDGATAITRRLLDWARLEGLDLDVEPFVNELPADLEDTPRYVVGFFRGIEAGVCRFGIHLPALDDPEYLAGVMAHEVAHAFRHHHELVVEDHDNEEELTDLTTVYLGSGTLVANLADWVALGRTPDMVTLRRSKGGYLGVEDLAFLLALQLRARGADCGDIERVCAFLGSSQAYCLRHALDALQLDQLALLAELGIHRTVTAPTTYAPPEHAAPLTGAPPRYRYAWGHTAYRAQHSLAIRGSVFGLLGGLVYAVLLHKFGVNSAFAWPGLGSVIGAGLGRLRARVHCSNADCGAVLTANARECPSCKRYMLGTLAEPPVTFAVGNPTRNRVKRLVGYRTASYASWGTWFGGCLGGALAGLGFPFALVWLALPGALAGVVLGRKKRRDLCGSHQCDTVIEDFVRVCPRCLSEVWGEARTRLELL